MSKGEVKNGPNMIPQEGGKGDGSILGKRNQMPGSGRKR